VDVEKDTLGAWLGRVEAWYGWRWNSPGRLQVVYWHAPGRTESRFDMVGHPKIEVMNTKRVLDIGNPVLCARRGELICDEGSLGWENVTRRMGAEAYSPWSLKRHPLTMYSLPLLSIFSSKRSNRGTLQVHGDYHVKVSK
jgi:hypothetical protein